MKTLSHILTIVLCCAPLAYANGAGGNVATTAGSNLTAFNPSTAYNNQWATMTNGRYDDATPAKTNFGNCNALILRCAQPKCSNGGCADSSVAGQIVAGCVKSNDKCKQYGDDLVGFMTAQLVADSNSKINQQNAALEQAKIQAEAQAAAAAANAQSEQMAQMQAQMVQMQQQMAQQQAESAQQLQAALAQQAAQNQAALDNMKVAATESDQQTESGVSSYEQDAINRGVSADILERKKITGQIMTEIEDAELKLKNVKTVLQNSFNYAGCDARGNNCTGPKRVKKWRELASAFIDDYDTAVDKIYDALMIAAEVGIDLSQVYAMLDGSCSSWSQYMCPGVGSGWYVTYGYTDEDGNYQSAAPRVCKGAKETQVKEDEWKKCKICTRMKTLTDGEDIYAGWLSTDQEAKDNQSVVACASSVDGAKIFARRTRQKNQAGMVDIENLDRWLHQTEPINIKPENAMNVCYVAKPDQEERLKKAIASKSLKDNLCCEMDENYTKCNKKDDTICSDINPIYAICDTHMFNSGISKLGEQPTTVTTGAEEEQETIKVVDVSEQDAIKQMLGLKITVISQQMYKQYEYLNATLKRLTTQLEKAALTATLETAGADSARSGGLAGSASKNSQYRDCSGKNKQGALDCLRENYSALSTQISGKKCTKSEKEQLQYDIKVIKSVMDDKTKVLDDNCKNLTNVEACKDCLHLDYSGGLSSLDKEIRDDESNRYRRYY